VGDELGGHLLLGRVKDEDVGWCRGVVDMQDAKDILGLVPHLRRHRQEIKYCVILRVSGNRQSLLHVEDVVAEVKHPETLLLAKEIHQSDAAPQETVTKLLPARHSVVLRWEAVHKLQSAPQTIELGGVVH
jgi:hypothetical protein